jgi:hypothetical protein
MEGLSTRDYLRRRGERLYEVYMREGMFTSAAIVAKVFNLGEDKVKSAAEKEYEVCMREGRSIDAAVVAKVYGLGEDKRR